MKIGKIIRIIIPLALIVGLSILGYNLYDRGRPAPVPVKETLYEGVIYRRIVRVVPRPMIAHVIVIDKRASGAQFLVTLADSKGEYPLNARTTSQFLDQFNVQIAVNGDGFTPWWSRSPVDYYPHEGDPVRPLGFTASERNVYAEGNPDAIGVAPTLYISRRNDLSVNTRPGAVWSAISGDRMLVSKGEMESGLDDTIREPRTAIGINQNGRFIYLIVADGRQPYYSEGTTFAELAKLLIQQGAFFAMSLDGGGSSTMVVEGEDGLPVILNSPIDNYIPGRERPVANHFGVFINP